MGCDVEYFPLIGDAELVARAALTGRLILTRDTLLIQRKAARANHFFVVGDRYKDQLRQVIGRFAIDPLACFLTRCLKCNVLLVDIEKDQVRERVPPYVLSTQDIFHSCPSCGRLYWRGTHRAKMAKEIKDIFPQQNGSHQLI